MQASTLRGLSLLQVACSLTLVAGCAHYAPKPMAPQSMLQDLQQRRLTNADVLRRVRAATTEDSSPAAETSPVSWGRAELLVASLQLNPTLNEARAQLAQATAAVTTARAIQNPTLSLSSEYDLSRAGEPTWLWGVGTSFLLDTFVSRNLRTDLAQASVRGAHADFSEAIWTVRRDVRAALLAWVMARRRVDALAKDSSQRAELLRLARARIAEGESARPEGLQAELELSRTQLALDDARRTQLDARANLAAAIGVTAAALDEVTPEWSDLENLPVAPESLGALRDKALLSRPDLERAIADYSARELDLKQQVSAQYLQASLGPGYTYDHGVRKLTFGGSLSLPVFNQNEGPIAEAVAAREAAGRHAITVQATVLNEIETASQAYDTALSALERARTQRANSDEVASAARRALEVDASDRPTLLAAELAASTERLAEIDALERAQQALGQLEDAVRSPLAGPELRLHLTEATASPLLEQP